MNSDVNSILKFLEEAYSNRINNLDRSIEYAEKALNISRKIKNEKLIIKSLNQLSLYTMILGDYKKSSKYSSESIFYCQKIGDDKEIADAKYNIASVHYKTNNFHLGIIELYDALKIYKKYKNYHNISRTEKSLATIYEYIGDQKNAIKFNKNAISAAKKVNDLNLESNAYNNLSGILLKQNSIEEAMEMIEKSITIKTKTNDVRGLAFAIYGRGKVFLKINKFEESERDFLEAKKIHQEMGEKLGLAMVYNKLAELYFKKNETEKAKIVALESLNFCLEYNIVVIKCKCYFLLYKIYKSQNNFDSAIEFLEKYIADKEMIVNTQTLKVIENYDVILKIKNLENKAKLDKEKADILKQKKIAENTAQLKQEFLSTMSHEIRTPLNAITSIATLLKNNKTDKETQQLIDSLRFSSNNLMRIINNILDYTKLDAGKNTLELHPVNFKMLCENIINTYIELANEKGIKLILNSDLDSTNTVLIDETKFTQIIGNLISNAVKFTQKGHVQLEIKTISSTSECDVFLITISDTGEGIPENLFEKIFENFTQLKPVLNRNQGGTGLGLAIVKKLLELYGSQIQIKSEIGKGSEFYFELKLLKSIQEPIIVKHFNQNLIGKTALILEDNSINAMILKKILSNWGVVSDHVINGKLGLEKANSIKYDFILMDIHMPIMNGFETTKEIRTQNGINKNTTIFAMTADVFSKDEKQFNSFFDQFLWKPIEMDILFDALVKYV